MKVRIYIFILIIIMYHINCDSFIESDLSFEHLICNQTTKLILPDAVDEEVIEANINNGTTRFLVKTSLDFQDKRELKSDSFRML